MESISLCHLYNTAKVLLIPSEIPLDPTWSGVGVEDHEDGLEVDWRWTPWTT